MLKTGTAGSTGSPTGQPTATTTPYSGPVMQSALSKPLIKIDINGYGVIKTFQVESQETFHDLCLRVADKMMIDPKEATEYRLFLIETNQDKDSL